MYISDTITREYSFLNFKPFVFCRGHSNPEVGQPSPQNTYMWIRTWIIFWFVNSERPENFSSQYLNYRPKITGEDSFSFSLLQHVAVDRWWVNRRRHCQEHFCASSTYASFFSCGICQNLKICLFGNWGMSDVKYLYKRQAWLLKFCQTTNNAWKL